MFGSTKSKKSVHEKKNPSGQFYFVQHNPGVTESVRDIDDNVDVIELKEAGSTEEEYQPKPVNRNLVKGMSMMKEGSTRPSKSAKPNAVSRTLSAIFGGNKPSSKFYDDGAKKVNQKLFFANERTFLKWMNVSIWVAAISIGLSTISPTNGGKLEAVCSLLFSLISIVIICHSMFQYGRRSLLVLKRSPGPYEDRYGPVVIGSLFVFAFTAQYCIMMAKLSMS